MFTLQQKRADKAARDSEGACCLMGVFRFPSNSFTHKIRIPLCVHRHKTHPHIYTRIAHTDTHTHTHIHLTNKDA